MPSSPPNSAIIVLDTETTSAASPELIESAYMYLDPQTLLPLNKPVVQRFKPEGAIEYGAMATHHILPHELEGCPSPGTFTLPKGVQYVAGHNIEFDLSVIGRPEGVIPIDTLLLARKVWPDADSHKLSALYYKICDMRGQSLIEARDRLRNAHSADVDIEICAVILQEIVEQFVDRIELVPQVIGSSEDMPLLERLATLTEAARIPMEMGFGKHKGMAPWEVPQDYKSWYARQADTCPLHILSMTRGGDSPEGEARFNLAVQFFGPGALNDSYAPAPLPVHTNRSLSF